MFLATNKIIFFSSVLFIFFIVSWFIYIYKFSQIIYKNKHNIKNRFLFIIKKIFGLIGFLFLYIASLGYCYPQNDEEIKSSSNIFILLDVSRSMLAQDCQGKTRIEAAKENIFSIIDNKPFGSVGVILFSKDDFVLVPPTFDMNLVKSLINSLDENFVVSGSSSIRSSLERVISKFENLTGQKKIIIFSDGEFQEDYQDLVPNLNEKNISIDSVLLGTNAGAPISEFKDGKLVGHLKHNNEIVISKACSKLLQEISKKTDGSFFIWPDSNTIDFTCDFDFYQKNISLISLSWIFSCFSIILFILERFL